MDEPGRTWRALVAAELVDVEVTDHELVERLLDQLGRTAPRDEVPLAEAAAATLTMLRSVETRPTGTAHADLVARVADQQRRLRRVRTDAGNLDNIPARRLLRQAVDPSRTSGESR